MKILRIDENILLKEIEMNDASIIFETIAADRFYLRKWLPFVEETNDIEYTRTYIQSILDSPTHELVFTIFYQDKFIGLLGTKDSDAGNKKTEIGFWLSEKYQHKGIMHKACRAIIDIIFNEFELNRIQLKAAEGNFSSQKVAQRLGFKQEGVEREGEHHRHGFVDLVVFGLLKSEWNSLSNIY